MGLTVVITVCIFFSLSWKSVWPITSSLQERKQESDATRWKQKPNSAVDTDLTVRGCRQYDSSCCHRSFGTPQLVELKLIRTCFSQHLHPAHTHTHTLPVVDLPIAVSVEILEQLLKLLLRQGDTRLLQSHSASLTQCSSRREIDFNPLCIHLYIVYLSCKGPLTAPTVPANTCAPCRLSPLRAYWLPPLYPLLIASPVSPTDCLPCCSCWWSHL